MYVFLLCPFSYFVSVFRWACSTIERGYSPTEASELRAIASFHHPQGFVYGYIKMVNIFFNFY